MNISSFNALDSNAAAAVLQPCADIDRWVEAIVAARPFASANELLETAATAASPFTEAEIDAALAHHPRIGERAAGSSAEATLSHLEQSGLDIDERIAADLLVGNRAYEERFSRVFLIRAAGRTSEEILAELHRRLANDPATEMAEVGEQLRAIALLRLTSAFDAVPAQ
ncbi:2-oxo-4-hydroxy-4-carboxy-5-ureidoimidazoline decarboxylase [Paeniglutamicibacter psychrophenolicus]|uniref:2-oxo-4-hydroxy-4-carboxy-5-ureidoimidazoline decarboxylase n=1 Tax=Paeniglutamicibacter psychrophenolicus TaxID=257454 RepID=A0ABS4W941_9MICC|nr:2-oxo-4-hydroxy-4-carboxy-5-ureidoimidazoline decarboxylase [Paeniglutamicibacter psychrophenolicus]MBP2372724.1 2-oxo-4-hydroxy-4-carboxy-5-ureidoimidazoline decarboxylase [Paeniglutamicibacter psychrophenolicus]